MATLGIRSPGQGGWDTEGPQPLELRLSQELPTSLSSTHLSPGLRLSALSALGGLCPLGLLLQAAWLGTQPGKPLTLCMLFSGPGSPGAPRHLLNLFPLLTAAGYRVCSQ